MDRRVGARLHCVAFVCDRFQFREMLDASPGVYAPTLAEETVVVVLSEMGRTPGINGTDGKDHWPWTSAMGDSL